MRPTCVPGSRGCGSRPARCLRHLHCGLECLAETPCCCLRLCSALLPPPPAQSCHVRALACGKARGRNWAPSIELTQEAVWWSPWTASCPSVLCLDCHILEFSLDPHKTKCSLTFN